MSKQDILATTGLLEQFLQKGIALSSESGQLKIKARKGVSLSEEDKELIRRSREQLIDYLNAHQLVEASATGALVPIERPADGWMPASPGQERTWYVHQLQESAAYHLEKVMRLKGKLDKALLQRAFLDLIERHEALRTVLAERDDTIWQQVRPCNEWMIEQVSASEEKLAGVVDAFINRPFRLEQDIMVRAMLIETGVDEYLLAVVLHHAASDGWSVPVMAQELAARYEALLVNETPSLPQLAVQYADYSVWHRQFLNDARGQQQLQFWAGQLEGAEATVLAYDRPRGNKPNSAGKTIFCKLNPSVRQALENFSKEEGVTRFVAALSGFMALLYRYTDEEELCIGTPVANRTHREVENLIGYFSNTVVLRMQLDSTITYRELLPITGKTVMEAFGHQEVPYQNIVEEVARRCQTGAEPLFRIFFSWEPHPEDTVLKLPGLTTQVYPYANPTAKFDMLLSLADEGEGLRCALEFDTSLYDSESMERVLAQYALLLPSLLSTPDLPIHQLSFLPAEELQRYQSNKPAKKSRKIARVARVSTNETLSDTESRIKEVWTNVLGTAPARDEDFFNIGGDSIKAIRVTGQIKKQFGGEMAVTDLYEHPTLSSLAAWLDCRQENLSLSARRGQLLEQWTAASATLLQAHPHRNRIEEAYPMTDIQKGMVFASMSNPEESVYHHQFVFEWPKANVDLERFQHSFTLMVRKHPILRTAFDMTSFSEEMQLCYREVPSQFIVENITVLDARSQISYINSYLAQERTMPFVPQSAPLWRGTVFVRGDHPPKFVFQCHHAILDGWSIASLFAELHQVYDQLCEDANYQTTAVPLGMKEAVLHDVLAKENPSLQNFWKEQLEGYKRLSLFTDEPVRQMHVSHCSAEMLKKLQAACTTQGCAIKDLFFAAYLFALGLLTDEDEVTAGMVSNRRPPAEGGDQLLGCFLNTLPVRFRFQPATYRDYVSAVSETLRHIRANEDVTLFDLSAYTDKDGRQNPFFDTLLNFINFHVLDSVKHENLTTDHSVHASQASETLSYDASNTFLNVTTDVAGGQVRLRYMLRRTFRSGLSLADFDGFMHRFLNCFLYEGGKPCRKQDVFSGNMKQQLENWGISKAYVPEGQTVVSLFQQTAQRVPSNTALVFEGQSFTYDELDRRSNQVARVLLQHGVAYETLVPVSVKRSAECIIAMLGVLKAGAAFVPIDAALPAQRVRYLLNDTQATLFLSDRNESAAGDDITVIGIRKNAGLFDAQPDGPVGIKIKTAQLAYVIYTSGSTGQPKGVMLEHDALLDHLYGLFARTNLQDCASFAFVASLAADAGHSMLFSALIIGAAVHILSEEKLMDGMAMTAYVQEHAIDCIKIVPSLWLSYADDGIYLLTRRCMIFGGEAFQPRVRTYLRKAGYTGLLFNHYGPTETAIGKLVHPVSLNSPDGPVPMGRPFSNTQVYVVDRQGNLCPPGVTGELWIGGRGIARGYLHLPERTEAVFIPDAFRGTGRIYKTGDLVRWSAEGQLEFHGRRDEQIKINGQRIEVGEVEHVLMRCPLVKQCFVCARQRGATPQLVAYVVTHEEFDRASLVAYMEERVPDYMVPTAWMPLKALPVNLIGKIDRAALPAPDEAAQQSTPYAAPRDNTETVLVSIWEELLKKAPIGIHDNFFAAGGHSLLMVRVIAHIRQRLEIIIPVTALFRFPTIAGLSDYIQAVCTAPADDATAEVVEI